MAAHSDLGGSGMERWEACPGSVNLLRALGWVDDDDEDFRRDGLAAHEMGAAGLTEDLDTWEMIDREFYKGKVVPIQAAAVQFYLDHVRGRIKHLEENDWHVRLLVEESFRGPHPKQFGTLDAVLLCSRGFVAPVEYVEIWDYKHGEGIAVNATGNKQLRYYARLLQCTIEGITTFRTGIVQPRGFHPLGPVREEVISASVLIEWDRAVLQPALALADSGKGGLNPGEWCRFCPVKVGCSALQGMAKFAFDADPTKFYELSDEELARTVKLLPTLPMYAKAINAEAHKRLTAGKKVGDLFLVHAKTDRVWHDGAEAAMAQRFGDAAYERKFKSPAKMEALPGAKLFVKELAYSPIGSPVVAAPGSTQKPYSPPKGSEVWKDTIIKS